MSDLTTPDIEAIKARHRLIWTAGDFGIIAKSLAQANEDAVARVGITPGMKVLDVACGTGNSAIPAAKRGADVIGVDIAPNLLEQARARAKAEGVQVRFEEGDAEKLAFEDNSFDLVVSIFGAMLAPRPELVASEFKRVVKPGGRILMCNWTTEGLVGQMQQIAVKYVPPPPGQPHSALWGDEAIVRQRFGTGLSKLEMNKRIATMTFPTDEAGTVALFVKHMGPTIVALQQLDTTRQQEYLRELEEMYRKHNKGPKGQTKVESEFLEVVATKA